MSGSSKREQGSAEREPLLKEHSPIYVPAQANASAPGGQGFVPPAVVFVTVPSEERYTCALIWFDYYI